MLHLWCVCPILETEHCHQWTPGISWTTCSSPCCFPSRYLGCWRAPPGWEPVSTTSLPAEEWPSAQPPITKTLHLFLVRSTPSTYPLVTSRFWSSLQPWTWVALSPQVAQLGAHVSPERLWPFHLSFCLSPALAAEDHHVSFHRVPHPHIPRWEEKPA